MTPQFMTKSHNPPESYGDCLRACIASVLEVGLNQVPAFEEWYTNLENDQLWGYVREFLDGYGLTSVIFPEGWFNTDTFHFHYIAVRRTKKFNYHATVEYAGKVVHDPDPKNPVLRKLHDDCIIMLVRK